MRTKSLVKNNFWWPAVDKEVEVFVKECQVCNAADKSLKTLRPPMSDGLIPSLPWEVIAIDLFGPVGESRKYGLVAMDLFTKWPIVKIVEKVDTHTVLKFMDKIFTTEGLPECVLSDNGVQFTSREARAYFDRCGIRHKTTSLYNPSGNGTVERFNRVLKGVIQAAMNKRLDWKLEVQKAVWTYKVTTHVATHLSPFIMMRGRAPRCKFTPGWLLRGKMIQWDPVEVENNLNATHLKSKECYDSHHGAKEVPVTVGDWVRVKKPFKVPKGGNMFEAPQQVIEVLRNAVRLDDGRVWNLKRVAFDLQTPEDRRVVVQKSPGISDWVEDYFDQSQIQTSMATEGKAIRDESPYVGGNHSTQFSSPVREGEVCDDPSPVMLREPGPSSAMQREPDKEGNDLGGKVIIKRKRVPPGWLKEYVM